MELIQIVDLIAKVPESIWGAIAGSALTLIGIGMTNRHSRKQHAQQLEFDSRERQRERHASLMRDAYLPAADSYIGLVSGMSKFLYLETPDGYIGEKSEAFGAALTRIQMIASTETIKRAAELQRAIVTTISAIQQLRHPMKVRESQINFAIRVQESRAQQLEAFEVAVPTLDPSSATSVDVERHLDALYQLQLASERHDGARIEFLRLLLEQETARVEMVREFANRLKLITTLHVPLLAAIRDELGSDDALSLMALETEKTNEVGLRAVTDMIPVAARAVENIRKDLDQLEGRKRAAAVTTTELKKA